MSYWSGDDTAAYRDDWSAHASAANRSGSVAAGLFMVVAGVGFLAARTVPGVDLWTMWPLLIVAGGLVQLVTPGVRGWGVERLSEGVGTVLLGVILLGNTTGYIGWEMWLTALTLWPVLLVAAGIGVLGRASGQAWVRAAAPVIIWAALLYAASTAVTGVAVPVPVLAVLGLQ